MTNVEKEDLFIINGRNELFEASVVFETQNKGKFVIFKSKKCSFPEVAHVDDIIVLDLDEDLREIITDYMYEGSFRSWIRSYYFKYGDWIRVYYNGQDVYFKGTRLENNIFDIIRYTSPKIEDFSLFPTPLFSVGDYVYIPEDVEDTVFEIEKIDREQEKYYCINKEMGAYYTFPFSKEKDVMLVNSIKESDLNLSWEIIV